MCPTRVPNVRSGLPLSSPLRTPEFFQNSEPIMPLPCSGNFCWHPCWEMEASLLSAARLTLGSGFRSVLPICLELTQSKNYFPFFSKDELHLILATVSFLLFLFSYSFIPFLPPSQYLGQDFRPHLCNSRDELCSKTPLCQPHSLQACRQTYC